MFMSEFQHNDNGRPFVDEWFSRLETHPTIVTTTPGEFLETERPPRLTLLVLDLGSMVRFRPGLVRPKKALDGSVLLRQERH